MLNIGHILDNKYEVIKVLGQGGMGTVYLCKNNRLGNLWAVKETKIDESEKINFLAESNILKDLVHDGIPRIVDIFYEQNYLYMVEDYIEGETLKEYISKYGSLNPEKLIDISLQLCSILDYLHNFNPPIIYRDLKPSNIMLQKNGKVILVDFGISRTYKENQDSDTIILGSKGYIAPEQLMNVQSNVQTDIYSLGATMYFMTTGRMPSYPTEIINKDNYPKTMEYALVNIMLKASAIEPENRYRDIRELKETLINYIYNLNNFKTKAVNRDDKTILAPKTELADKKIKTKKPVYKILAALIIILAVILILLTSLINSNKSKLSNTNTPDNTASKNTGNNDIKKNENTSEPKQAEEKDIISRGVLFKNNAITLKSSSSGSKGKAKGKGKNESKDLQFQFNLNPNASISNSKFNIGVDSVQLIDNTLIANLNIENKTKDLINIDLEKTYFTDENNEAIKCYNPSAITKLPIPPSSVKQGIKIYFKNFNFNGTTYTINSSLSGSISRDINLFIDVK
ncbi:serine/threonine protein kinase [Clostridium sp. YIM B02515]|uniref:non-specific serine/threonine protein kinase n=1 Tax=Clostridium rhizosphaerae TaxID=2803861 RepID=A0ABS1T8Q5_9CLOT|nr:serine/threonine-protein kinase [Clostridium rhizosphaerae]MBL4935714.1 serine/threonine protein kinase [Clostridium rhizosphaerae]